jgi:hypothetical protein
VWFQDCAEWGAADARELDGDVENVTFALPKELRAVLVD